MRDKFRRLFRQLFQAEAQASARRPFEIKAEGSSEATVYVYDVIGWPWMEAQDFVKDLAAIEAEVIHLRVNSPGGDVFDARAMQTAIRQHPARVIAHIDGLAASAATYLVMGADEIEMAEGAFFMIHNAWMFALGNSEELLKAAAMLEKVDASIRNDYRRKTGQGDEQIAQWMAEETWFSAEEALENGFVDRIFEGEEVDASWNLAIYDRVPDALKKQKGGDVQDETPDRATLERRLKFFEDFSA